ncbi:ABC transporter ATP-binding protein [Lacticaseibacillus hulanensis]|uniref:ABC transporter ATP-binding protein n=1 Tax=Lacticaseibacillus hulanensis TaxID=2493111 RepID=UPI000FDC0669|nr:ABC transporter ATP-binding protein [Lacticaseibacillus hulanensis]
MNNKHNDHQYGQILKFIYHLEPQAIWFSLSATIGQTLTPYLSLILLGLIINAVAAYNQSTNLVALISIIIPVIIVMEIAVAYIDHRKRVAQLSLNNQVARQINQKWTSVSNSLFNDPSFRSRNAEIDEGFAYEGTFSSFLTANFAAIINLIVALLVAGAGIISALISKGDRQPELARIANGPAFVLLMLILLIIPGVVAQYSGHKSSAIHNEAVSISVQINKVINYFMNHVFNEPHVSKTIRLYDQGQFLKRRMDSANTDNFDVNRKANFKASLYGGLTPAVIALTTAGAYLLLIVKYLTGAIPIGTIVIYAGFITQLISAVANLTNQMASTTVLTQILVKCIGFINMADPAASGTLPIEKRRDNKYQLEFHDVSFKYPGAKEFALAHINLKFAIGQRLALVGPNGSGKTTLIRLLTRLDKPTSGTITLNGIDIQKYNLHEYQQIFAAVFQDFKLFALSVLTNVAADDHPDRARVQTALKIAGVAARISRMNQGIDTPLTRELNKNGEDVSGGEAQKIAIARAWYKDAPFIILDEPTAALDPISEYEIYQHLDDLIADKTAIYISHRMSSTRFAQRIIVLNQGHIVKDGTHHELVNADGLYRDLFNAQAQYYTDERIAKERQNADVLYS